MWQVETLMQYCKPMWVALPTASLTITQRCTANKQLFYISTEIKHVLAKMTGQGVGWRIHANSVLVERITWNCVPPPAPVSYLCWLEKISPLQWHLQPCPRAQWPAHIDFYLLHPLFLWQQQSPLLDHYHQGETGRQTQRRTALIIISHSFLANSLHAFEVLFWLWANLKKQHPFILYGSTSNQVRTKCLRSYLQCCKGRAPRTSQSLKKQNRFQTSKFLTYDFLYFSFIVARMIVKIYGDELISKKVLSAQFSPKVMYHRAGSLQILRINKSTATSLTP